MRGTVEPGLLSFVIELEDTLASLVPRLGRYMKINSKDVHWFIRRIVPTFKLPQHSAIDFFVQNKELICRSRLGTALFERKPHTYA
jgi:hypothetical protein